MLIIRKRMADEIKKINLKIILAMIFKVLREKICVGGERQVKHKVSQSESMI